MTGESKLALGQIVERYTVEGRVGKGGAARVYRVRHATLGSLHALKVLHVGDLDMRTRLVQEGRVQAALRHPNIVGVTDVIDVGGSPGLVMDYIEGPTLSRWLKENRPTLDEAEAVFRGILAGVGRAHRLGLVHRDLKPGNVLMATDEGRLVPKVADFGLAKILADAPGAAESNTLTGTAMGTPAYMAPEQVRDSKSVDQRADVFALGCILYELSTGKSPFFHADVFEIFSALSSGSYTPPDTLVPGLPPRIVRAIRGCLVIDRNARIGSCTELLAVLNEDVAADAPSGQFSEESLLPSRLVSRYPARPTPGVRSMRVVGGLALLLLGGAGLAALVALLLVLASTTGWLRGRDLPPARAVVAAPVARGPVAEAPVPVVETPEPEAPDSEAPDSEAPEPEAPVLPRPAGRPSTATVRVVGDADGVWLDGASGRVAPGVVAAGEYRITASFKGQGPQPAGRMTVAAGQTVILGCSAAFQICQPK